MTQPRIFLAGLVASVALLAGCGGKSGDAAAPASTIKIGEFASLTGKEAAFGQSSHKGTLLAIEELERRRRHPRQADRIRFGRQPFDAG